jgi:hypothetical protein
MSPKLFYLKIIFYLFFGGLILGSSPLFALDVSDNEQKIKPLLAKVYRQEDVHNGWSVKNWMEYAQFGMVKSSVSVVEI